MTGRSDESLVAVRDYACDVAGCCSDRITAVSRFEDGDRHAVYKVSYLGPTDGPDDLVVRVSYGGGSSDCDQAEREARVLKRAGGIAAPVLYDFRCASPWFETPSMCMQFVPGHQRELSSATTAEIERLGSVVAWVHGRPTDDLLGGPSGFDNFGSYAGGRLQSIISRLEWVRDPVPAAVRVGLRGAADSVRRSWNPARDAPCFRSGGALALLHGDIGPGNILWGPDPVLIDWEYARLGDPADEIAYLFDQNHLSPDQREAFWRGYREGATGPFRDRRERERTPGLISGAPLAHVVDRVDWWEPVTLLGSALWWVERWVRRAEADAAGRVDPDAPRDPGYYADHVIRRLDRLNRLLAGP